jgi:hypothetical protein
MPLVLITSLIALVFQAVAPTANIRLPHLNEVVAVVMDESER